jgi:hypothetical protein
VELEKQANSARDLYPSPQNLDGVRVLAVNDNATNRRILRLEFAKWKTTEINPFPRVLTSWRALTMRGNAGRSDG